MPSVSSRIWTRVAVFISYDDNHYTTGTSEKQAKKQTIILCFGDMIKEIKHTILEVRPSKVMQIESMTKSKQVVDYSIL